MTLRPHVLHHLGQQQPAWAPAKGECEATADVYAAVAAVVRHQLQRLAVDQKPHPAYEVLAAS